MGSKNFVEYNAFDSNFEKIISRLLRKKKYSVTNNQNVVDSITTNDLSSKNVPIAVNTEADLMGLDKIKKEISSTSESVSEAWANRAKMKYVTVRPWNQFCLTCNRDQDIPKDICIDTKPTIVCQTTTPSSSAWCPTTASKEVFCNTFTTCNPRPTKKKKNYKQCFPTTQIASEQDQPWLFYADPTKGRPLPRIPNRPNPTDKCFTETTCKKKQRISNFNPERNNYVENFLIKRSRKKRKDYFLAAKSQLGILKSSLKRNKKATRRSRFLADTLPKTTQMLIRDIITLGKKKLVPLSIYNNNLLSKINKLKKRSSNERSNVVKFIPFIKHRKGHNLTGGIPPCQKVCRYNLTGLVNAQTIKPPGYFKKRPSLLLCCEDEETILTTLSTSSTSTSSTVTQSNELDDLEATTDIDNATDSDSNSVATDALNTSDNSSVTTVDSNVSNPTVFRMLLQFRNMPKKTGRYTSRNPKDKFFLKLLIRDKEDSTYSNGVKLESNRDNNENHFKSFVGKTRRPKKVHPWDSKKFCSRSDGKNKQTCCTNDFSGKIQPWASTCCLPCETTSKNSKSSKTTSKSGKTTKKDSKAITKGGNTTYSGSAATGSDSGAAGISSGETGTGSGVTTGSMVTGTGSGITTGSGATSSGSGSTSSGSGSTSSRGKATKKRRKKTSKGKKTTNRQKDKGTTVPYSPNLSVNIPLKSNKGTLNLSGSNSNQPEGYHKSVNTSNPVFDDDNILFVLRVPVALAQKYSENGNLRLVLPLNNTHFPRFIKPRSIFETFLPSLLRKTTLSPVTASGDKLRLLIASANVRKVQNYLSTIATNKPPFYNANVRKHITKACPSCLKKKKELVFETSNGDKKANCIIDDNDLFYEEEIVNDLSNNFETSTEECDGKYVSYLLKFPKATLTKTSFHPHFRESRSTVTGLKIIHSHGSPPKYFIEVPELLAEMLKMEENLHVTNFPSTSLKETSSSIVRTLKPLRHGQRKKPIVLCLQPFGFNGHKVYLPMDAVENALKNKAQSQVYVRNTDAVEYYNHDFFTTSSKPFFGGFVGNNDSVLPFALIPAYLAMHPTNPSSSSEASIANRSIDNVPKAQNSEFDVWQEEMKKKEGDIPLTILLNNIPIEKKLQHFSKLVKGVALTPPSKMTTKPSATPKKSLRKSSRPPVTSKKPTIIILMKDIANVPFLENYGFPLDDLYSSTLEPKDGFFMNPQGEYVN